MSSRGKSRFVLTFLASAAIFSLVALRAPGAQAQQPPETAPPSYEPQYYPEAAPTAPVADQAAATDPTQAQDGWGTPPDSGDQANGGAPLVPPDVEGPAYPASDGSYCYVGPHPVDTRVVPGDSWDNTTGQHMRPYAPIDTRLFSYRQGCYYFTGDPRDFGYGGQTHAYYGAHPILDGYGGGWCFMMGPHAHVWAPWSPSFTVVGSWNYWHGPFDPYFWAYWPYYSLYYRSYYPSYYGGGRFYRGGGWRVAPAIRPVQVQSWRGNHLRGGPTYGGTPPGPTVRGMAPGPNAYRGNMTPPGAHTYAPSAGPGFHPAQPGFHPAQPGFHPAQPGFRPVQPSGVPSGQPGFRPVTPSFRTGGPAFNHPAPAFRAPSAGPSRPSFSPGPGPRSFSPGPGARSFSPPGGGFHGGGGGFRRH